MSEAIEAVRMEAQGVIDRLRGWQPGSLFISADGSSLLCPDENDDDNPYVTAESTYYGSDTDPHPPFLATVLEAIQIIPKLTAALESATATTTTNEGSN